MSNKYPGGIITSGASVGSSVAFDGNGDYLQVGSNAAFNFSASDCTIECWFFAATTPGSETEIVEFGTGLTSGDIQLIWDSGGQFTFGGSGQTKNRYTFPSGRWYYLAAVKSGVNWYLYIDGVQYVTQTSGAASSSNYVNIGSRNASGNWVTGNIYNLRISNVARYSGATAAMANVLTTDANTKLLTCVGRTITDLSGNNFAITVGGNAYMSSYGPPGYTAYNPALGAATPGIWSVSDAIQAAQTRRWNMYDPYFNYTTLLLHGNGTNGAQNNTFLDSSSNNFTITRNGNTTQGTFSPFSQTGWSNYFNGSSDALAVAGTTEFQFGTGDFTVEMFIFSNSFTSEQFLSGTYDGSNGGWGFYIPAGGTTLAFRNGDVGITTRSFTFSANTWYYVAVTRSSSTLRFFVNGSQIGTDEAGYTQNITRNNTNGCAIARYFLSTNLAGSYFGGYISNLRVIKGTAQYTGSYTVPTSALTAVTNTQLLTCQSNRFVDTNTQVAAKTITIAGTPSVQAFSPFYPLVAYTPTNQGGSGYFDGSGDYLTAPSNAAFAVGTVFTFEFWVYPTVTLSSTNFFTANVSQGFQVGFENSSNWGLGAYLVSWELTTSTLPRTNQWNHIVVARSGTGTNQTSIFLNGARVANGTSTRAFSTAADASIGAAGAGNGIFQGGYFAGMRLIKGTDVYGVGNTSITIPTAPPTAITNTVFLLNFTNAGIIDSTAKNALETVGNAQISTTQSKFGGSSMYFDGTGDRLYFADGKAYVNGTEPFTLECWVYLGGTPNYWTIFGSSSSNGLLFTVQNLTTIIVNPSGLGNTVSGTTSLTAGTWFHLALTRNSANRFDIWVNGASIGNATSTQSFGTPTMFVIGAADNSGGQQFNGYLDDVRITKGYARYTGTFTPQTSQWQDQ